MSASRLACCPTCGGRGFDRILANMVREWGELDDYQRDKVARPLLGAFRRKGDPESYAWARAALTVLGEILPSFEQARREFGDDAAEVVELAEAAHEAGVVLPDAEEAPVDTFGPPQPWGDDGPGPPPEEMEEAEILVFCDTVGRWKSARWMSGEWSSGLWAWTDTGEPVETATHCSPMPPPPRGVLLDDEEGSES